MAFNCQEIKGLLTYLLTYLLTILRLAKCNLLQLVHNVSRLDLLLACTDRKLQLKIYLKLEHRDLTHLCTILAYEP